MQDEIEQFFRSYCAAYNRLDPSGVSAHVALPCILVARDSAIWTTREQVHANMARLVARYRKNGFEQADCALANLKLPGRDEAVADVLWTIRRGAQAPWSFHTGYNLHRFADGWRIVLCTAYEEERVRDDEG